jgi:hypothetical protein
VTKLNLFSLLFTIKLTVKLALRYLYPGLKRPEPTISLSSLHSAYVKRHGYVSAIFFKSWLVATSQLPLKENISFKLSVYRVFIQFIIEIVVTCIV